MNKHNIKALGLSIIFFLTMLSVKAQVFPSLTNSSYDVSASGAFSYSVPIEIPPGIRQLAPNLSITYNSQSQRGNLGTGWSLSGLSAISRTGKTMYHNKNVTTVDFNANDIFVLDGQRMFSTGSNTYMTEIKNFANIQSFGTAGNGPSYFTVEFPDGSTCEYGNTVNSKMLAQGKADVYIWAINKITDRCGNYISFDYLNDVTNGVYRVTKITYGLNSNVGTGVATDINFNYTTKPDGNKAWIGGSQIWDYEVLDNIDVKHSGVTINTYTFTYEHQNPSTQPIDYYTHLVKIQETRPGSVQLPPINITWGTTTTNNYSNILLSQNASADYLAGDFNGDGATDIVNTSGIINNAPFYVNLSDKTGSSFTTVSTGSIHYTLSGTAPNSIPSMYSSSRKGNMYFDYNGDGYDDMIIIIADKTNSANPKMVIELYLSDGTNLNYTSTVYSKSIANPDWIDLCKVLPGDYDGDGRKELIILEPSSFVVSGSTWKATAYNVLITGNNFPTTGGVISSVNQVGSLTGGNVAESVIDFNGDGKDDFFRIVDGATAFTIYTINMSYPTTTTTALAAPNSSLNTLLSGAVPNKDYAVYPGDFNGDGRTDLLTWNQTLGWQIYYSKSNAHYITSVPSSVSSNIASNGPISFTGGVPDYNYRIADFDGDGQEDIIEIKNSSPKGYKVFYSFGFNGFLYEGSSVSSGFNIDRRARLGDFNGDGQTDIMGLEFTTSQYPAILYLHPDNQFHDVVGIDHAGKKLNIGYQNLAKGTATASDGDIYGYNHWNVNGHSPREYPYTSRQLPIKVVASLSDNISLNNTYTYQTLSIHLTGLGLLGFERMKIRDISSQKLIDNHYSLFPFWGTLGQYSKINFLYESSTYAFSDLANPQTVIKHNYLDEPGETTGNVRIIKEYANTTTDNGKGVYTETTQIHNLSSTMFTDFGLADSVLEDKAVHNSYVRTVTYNTYNASLPFYNRSKPTSTTITTTYPNKPSYSRQSTFLYNNQGLLQRVSRDPTIRTKYTDFLYDQFGNPTSSTLTTYLTSGVATRTINTLYTADGRYLAKETKYNGSDPFIDNYTYNVWGKVKRHESNLMTYLYEYDAVNRLTKTTHPDDVVSNFSYDWAFNSANNPPSSFTSLQGITPNLNGAQFVMISTTDNVSGKTETFYDFYDRVLRTTQPDVTGNPILTDTRYNIKGQLMSTTLPFTVSNPPVTTYYYYDDFDREIMKTTPGASTISTSYVASVNPGFLETTVTDNNTGNVKITRADPVGVYEVEENGVPTRIEYGSNGKPETITVNNNSSLVTTYAYDALDRLKTRTQPNSNTDKYTYDNFDQLILDEPANGAKYSYKYNSLGQVTQKSDLNNNVWNYTYCPSTMPGAGKLLMSEKLLNGTLAGRQKFDYNNASKITRLTETIDPTHIYTTEYTYDLLGRMKTHKYPSGLIVTYTYNPFGFLRELSVPSQKLWSLGNQNQFGQITSANYYNQFNQVQYTANRVFDNFGYPVSRQVYKSAGMTSLLIVSNTYSFDPASGNLLSRTNQLANLSENFSYGDFDRLTGVTNNASVPPLIMSYDNMGNILKKNDVTHSQYDWKYLNYALHTVPDDLPSNPSPQYLSSVRQPNTQNVQYSQFGRPVSIKEAGHEILYGYGPDNERNKAEYNKAQPTHKEKYYATDYEEVVQNGITKKISYIFVEGKPVSVVINTSGTDAIYHVETDYLGSITHLMDAQGAGIVEERSFDAWGRWRNPANWQYYPPNTSPNWMIDRGYTGHEHVYDNTYDFNIINMNARLYDPLVARMFAPDPYVVDATGVQAYNRYTYALNNPLKYTDPNGEWINFAIGAIIGGISGYLAGRANGAKGWGMVAYIAGGAAIGAATSGVAVGMTALGAPAIVAGGAAGAFAGAGFTGLATNWNRDAMLNASWKGALAGGGGAIVGAAIGGGWGAFAGAGVGSGLNTALNGGSWQDIAASTIIGGGIGWGMYQTASYVNWRFRGGNNIQGMSVSHRQYMAMQADYQRSRFWQKEFGGWLMNDGSVQRFPKSSRAPYKINGINKTPAGVKGWYHTHWDNPGKTFGINADGYVAQPGEWATSFTTTLELGPDDLSNPYKGFEINRYGGSYTSGNGVAQETHTPFIRFIYSFFFW